MKLTNNVFGNIYESVIAWCPTRSEIFDRNLVISIEGTIRLPFLFLFFKFYFFIFSLL
jgi:hypothetical protein